MVGFSHVCFTSIDRGEYYQFHSHDEENQDTEKMFDLANVL